MSSDPHPCIHHLFIDQVMKDPQKLAVELDDQCLTYAELLHSVQLLSTTGTSTTDSKSSHSCSLVDENKHFKSSHSCRH